MKLLLSEEGILKHFKACIPERKRNELFDLLTIDYMTELTMAAQAQLNHIFNLDIKTTVNLIDRLRKRLDKLLEREMAK